MNVIWMYYIRHVVIVMWPTSVSCVASLPFTNPFCGHEMVKCSLNVHFRIVGHLETSCLLCYDYCEFEHTALVSHCFLPTIGRYAILDAAWQFLRLQMQIRYANDLCYDWLISVYHNHIIHQAGPRCWILNRCGCANVWFNELVVLSILWIVLLVIIFSKWSILTGLKICVVNVNSFQWYDSWNCELAHWCFIQFNIPLCSMSLPGDFPVHPHLAWLFYHHRIGGSHVSQYSV